MTSNKSLIKKLSDSGHLKHAQIKQAMERFDRKRFIPEEFRNAAYLDMPVVIGYGATTTQPSTIAFMLEHLDIKPGHKVLEIGTGSGYLTALLSTLVGEKGRVYSVEILPEVAAFGDFNIQKHDLNNVKTFVANGRKGLARYAPYDRIVASADARRIPRAWKDQLKEGGILITPSRKHMVRLVKRGKFEYGRMEYPTFSFVDLK